MNGWTGKGTVRKSHPLRRSALELVTSKLERNREKKKAREMFLKLLKWFTILFKADYC